MFDGNMTLDFEPPGEGFTVALVVSVLSVAVLVSLSHYLTLCTRRRHFHFWTGAWLLYLLYVVLNAAFEPALANPVPRMVCQWCLGGAAILLLAGCAEFIGQPRRQLVFWPLVVLLTAWCGLGALRPDLALRARLPMFGAIGLAGLATGFYFYRFRRQVNFRGGGLMAFGFLLWGAHLASLPFLRAIEASSDNLLIAYAVLQLVTAIGMIVAVMEEQRSSAKQIARRMGAVSCEKKRLQSKVTVTEERYRQLFLMAHEAIVVAEARTMRILELNCAAEHLLGVPAAEAVGMDLPDFLPNPNRAGKGSGPDAGWFEWITRQSQVTVERPDGSRVPADANVSRIHWGGQAACQFCFYELTERVQLEHQLRLSDKLSALGRLISGVAHELNNPLAAIRGSAELMRLGSDLPEPARSNLEVILRETDRAAQMVGRFMAFSHHHKPHRRPVNLNGLLQQAVELFRFHPLAREVDFRLRLRPDVAQVWVDESQMIQVLNVLIANSLQAMEHQPHPKRLSLTVEPVQNAVRIAVEDSGPGVPEAMVNRIFEPFFSTREAGSGTGLGLSIAHTLVSDHGGRIACKRSALGGAAFEIELPVVQGGLAPEIKPAPARAQSHCADDRSSPADILVLDDEEGLARMLGELVRLFGHNSFVFTSADQALESLQNRDFDLVLSDYHMSGINGDEFYHTLVQRKPHMAKRVVFLTGDAVADGSHGFFETTRVPYLNKPFSGAQIRQVLQERLPGRQPAAAHGSLTLRTAEKAPMERGAGERRPLKLPVPVDLAPHQATL